MQKGEKGGGKMRFIKFFLLLGLIILAYVAYSASKVIYKKNQIQKEISALEEEAARIEKNNLDLKEKIAYFESRDFQEKEVRDKLSFQNPDENMVIVKPGLSGREKSEVANMAQKNDIEAEDIPIYKKWWSYFFKY